MNFVKHPHTVASSHVYLLLIPSFSKLVRAFQSPWDGSNTGEIWPILLARLLALSNSFSLFSHLQNGQNISCVTQVLWEYISNFNLLLQALREQSLPAFRLHSLTTKCPLLWTHLSLWSRLATAWGHSKHHAGPNSKANSREPRILPPPPLRGQGNIHSS